MAKPRFDKDKDPARAQQRWHELWKEWSPYMNRESFNLEEKEAFIVQKYFERKWAEKHVHQETTDNSTT
jgi:hypothetical protein